jgi:hypothetical protein
MKSASLSMKMDIRRLRPIAEDFSPTAVTPKTMVRPHLAELLNSSPCNLFRAAVSE